MEAESDVVVFNAGGGVEVDGRLNADGVGEVDVAALEFVTGSGEQSAALSDGNASE